MSDSNCIFCKIVNKEIPCDKVYEDEKFLAFLDIQPISNGHTLIIPKEHIIWMQDANDETISDIFKLSKKLMLSIKKGLGCDYVQLTIVGKDVPHFHIHLMPRYLNDNLPMWQTKKYKDGEKELVVSKILSSL